MDIRNITPTYAVSPQIAAEDLPAIVAAGFTTVICNRPNEEVPIHLQADAIRAATEAAGLRFIELPLTHDTIEAQLDAQIEAMNDTHGPVFAYCASGTRCSVIWSFAQVGHMPVSDIMAATQAAGYDLSALHPRLAELAQSKN